MLLLFDTVKEKRMTFYICLLNTRQSLKSDFKSLPLSDSVGSIILQKDQVKYILRKHKSFIF